MRNIIVLLLTIVCLPIALYQDWRDQRDDTGGSDPFRVLT